MKFVGTKYGVVAATLLVAAGAGAYLGKVPTKPSSWTPDLLSMMRDRSPGERAQGAILVKRAQAKLPSAVAAPVQPKPPVIAAALPAAPAAIAPLTSVATPAAAVLAPAVVPAAAPVALAAAAPASSGFFLPPIFFPGGGGGHGSPPPTVKPPSGGGGGGPPPVPGVPEPDTWLMMLVGFGLLGAYLRRQRSSLQETGPVHIRNLGLATTSRTQ